MNAETAQCRRCGQPLIADRAYCPHCGVRVGGAPRRFMRSETTRKIAGVCGGLAEYFDLDPTLVRVGYVAATCFTGFAPGIVLYAVLALAVPAR